MKRKTYRAYALLALFLIVALSLSPHFVDSIRSKAVGVTGAFSRSTSKCLEAKAPLEVENTQLKAHNEKLVQLLLSVDKRELLAEKIENISSEIQKHPQHKELLERRRKEVETSLELESHSSFARVSCRDRANWGDALWIGIGERDFSRGVEFDIGSPVLSGAYVIGIVDYVGKKHSRVRLLTDPSLTPSVRAVRGNIASRRLIESIERIQLELSLSGINGLSSEDSDQLRLILSRAKEKLGSETGDKYLAKGELLGSSGTEWRRKAGLLRGEGFNYDFSDSEGEALELRTGAPMDKVQKVEGISLIEVGDLLVTTGFDGVFPAGLPVATVTDVSVLQEGAVAYDIEAALCAGSLNEIEEVAVLPSMQFFREKK